MQKHDAAHWIAAFDALGIPAETINTLPEILAHPQVADRRMLIDIEYPPGSGRHIPIAGMPWRAVAAERPVRAPPTLGQHTDEVLHELAALAAPART